MRNVAMCEQQCKETNVKTSQEAAICVAVDASDAFTQFSQTKLSKFVESIKQRLKAETNDAHKTNNKKMMKGAN